MLLTFCMTLLLAQEASAIPTELGEGPQPALNPIAWEFELKFEDPQRIDVSVPGRGTEAYWYMLYTVTNTSDRTQRYYPTFQIVTEDLRVYDTDIGIHPTVFGAIRELNKIRYKYLVSPTEAGADLRSGDDNARESVAIWREIDLNVNHFSVFVAGLSGEAYAVRNPAYDPASKGTPSMELDIAPGGQARATFAANPKHFTLRKTLQIEYVLSASAESRGRVEPRRTRVRWVMR